MKRLVLSAFLMVGMSFAEAYGIATFTGRSEYLGNNRMICEYMTNGGMVFTIIVDGQYCPFSTDV